MTRYVGRRILYMIPTLVVIAFVSFVIIQLPPGDYVTALIAKYSQNGETLSQAQIAALRREYGLDQPFLGQFVSWTWGILTRGDFGQSFQWTRPVRELLLERLPLTILLVVSTLLFTWVVAFPIAIVSAVRHRSAVDYGATFVGFAGMSVPNFMIALVLMYLAFRYFGQSVGGFFSPEFAQASWNLGKVLDLLKHLWIPVVVMGTAGTASLVRVLRANLLDELRKPYVVAARARGVPEWRLLLKYPLRSALNPFISTVGWVLPQLISGEVIIAQVLSLPTTGPLLLDSLTSKDMYLAGSIILIAAVLTVIGTLLSDILLAWLDPRVRHQYR